jgi:hypothetical protein
MPSVRSQSSFVGSLTEGLPSSGGIGGKDAGLVNRTWEGATSVTIVAVALVYTHGLSVGGGAVRSSMHALAARSQARLRATFENHQRAKSRHSPLTESRL